MILLIPIALGVAIVVLAVMVFREQMAETYTNKPVPTYYVRHPDGTFSEAEAMDDAHELLRAAALPFLRPHSGLCMTMVDGVLKGGKSITPETCRCNEADRRLRTALGAW